MAAAVGQLERAAEDVVQMHLIHLALDESPENDHGAVNLAIGILLLVVVFLVALIFADALHLDDHAFVVLGGSAECNLRRIRDIGEWRQLAHR